MKPFYITALTICFCWSSGLDTTPAFAADWLVIEANRHHLNTVPQAEWSWFADESEGNRFQTKFRIDGEPTAGTLLIRQTDVRLTWKVSINGTEVGRLQRDENDLIQSLSVPTNAIRQGENELVIESNEKTADDIQVGPIRWSVLPAETLLHEATVNVHVTDIGSQRSLPCRLTIIDQDGSLVPIGGASTDTLAIRTGVVYTSTGRASFGLAAGKYRIYAGRGFEYGSAQISISVEPRSTEEISLSIGRQVNTDNWVACDTHVHTVTHSGHGDATVAERMVTLAGEGIELPIATDHNKQINYQPDAERQNVRQFFTPVIGNEVTTYFGHFNAFPFRDGVPTPDHTETDWDVLLPSIKNTPDVEVVILNHGRDVHRGYRPFAPENFNAASGDSLDNRQFSFNAMETLNSGAQQTDPLELFRDWMTLTNRGWVITPIGSSDSHDVNRYIVGQGRTYVRTKDSDPGNIDVEKACRDIRDGHVIVSAGLFVNAIVDDRFGPGDLVLAEKSELSIRYSVDCPEWIHTDRVTMFQNGIPIRTTEIRTSDDRTGTWKIARPKHDVFWTVLALGPGIRHPSWPIAQPYQPDSRDWTPKVLSFTGAIRVDVDGDKQFTSARGLADKLCDDASGDFAALIESLKDYDQAVAVQAASLWQSAHSNLLNEPTRSIWQAAEPACRDGFAHFIRAWRDSEIARVENP